MEIISSILKLNDKRSSVFDKVQKDGENLKKSLDGAIKRHDEIDKKSQKASSSQSSFFKGILGESIIQKYLNMITNQLDSAIKRFDLLNKCPNIM